MAVKWGPLEEADIGDTGRLLAVLDTYRPAALMHFAAYAYVGKSVAQPLLYYQNNFTASATLLEAVGFGCISGGIFIQLCDLRPAESIPISEDHPQCPINPYREFEVLRK